MSEPSWLVDSGLALGFISAISCTYVVVLVTQLERGLRKKGKGGRCTALLVVRMMCAAEVGLHARDIATQLVPRAIGEWCLLSSFMAQACANAAIFYTFVIALDVLLSVRRPMTHRSEAYLTRYIGAVSAASVASGLVAILPGITDTDVVAGIDVTYACLPSGNWKYLFYAPLWAAMLFCCAVLGYFIAKKRRAARKGQTQKRSTRQKLVNRMALFTAVFVLQWLPLSIVNMCVFAGRDVVACAGVFTTNCVTLFDSSTGLCDALVWYGPICNHASRERVPISEIAALRGLVRERWAARRNSMGELTESSLQDDSPGIELVQEGGGEAAPSSNPLTSGANPGV
jgi:hypothetical protein